MPAMEVSPTKTITVAIPCYNEAMTIARVITDFRRELPQAEIVVIDNRSSDATAAIAREHGARVIYEKKKGKGHAVQRMFRSVDADILVMVDGDATYAAEDVHRLLRPMLERDIDMVVGNRLHKKKMGFTYSHRFGNAIFRFFLNYFFGTHFRDILSGYRALSKEFYQGVPLLAGGFEIETEMTLQSLERGYSVVEVPIRYAERPAGSFSKISAFKDGPRIILTIISLLRDYRPMTFFSFLGGAFILAGIFFGSVVVKEYYLTGHITRMPTAILSTALVLVGVNAVISGLILSAVGRRQRETEAMIKKISDTIAENFRRDR